MILLDGTQNITKNGAQNITTFNLLRIKLFN